MDIFTVSFYIPGTLSGNHSIHFKLPVDAQLIHVSQCNTANTDAVLDIGYTGSLEAYLADMACGDSSVAAEADWNDFVGSQYPHISKATNIILTLDYDGSSGTAAANWTCVLTFTQG